MANVLFKRIEDSALINNYPIVDGSFYVTKDGKSYVDYDDTRVNIGGTPDSQMSDRSTNAVENNVVKKYIDDVGDRVSVFEYDLITDGDEIKLGYKVDGKDVYAKKISFTTPSTEVDYTINLDIIDLNKIIKMYGMISDTTPIPYAIWFGTTPYYTSFRINNGAVIYKGSSAYGNTTAYLIVEYTKSN